MILPPVHYVYEIKNETCLPISRHGKQQVSLVISNQTRNLRSRDVGSIAQRADYSLTSSQFITADQKDQWLGRPFSPPVSRRAITPSGGSLQGADKPPF